MLRIETENASRKNKNALLEILLAIADQFQSTHLDSVIDRIYSVICCFSNLVCIAHLLDDTTEVHIWFPRTFDCSSYDSEFPLRIRCKKAR